MLSPLVKSRLLHRWRWQKWDKQIFLQWSVWSSGPENNPPLLPLQTRSAWPRNQSNSAMAEIPHDMHCKTEYNITNKQPFRTFQLGINYLMTQTRVFILRAGTPQIYGLWGYHCLPGLFILKRVFPTEKFQIKKVVPEKTKCLPGENFDETPHSNSKFQQVWTVVWIKAIVTKPKSTFKANLCCLVLGGQTVKKLVFIWI